MNTRRDMRFETLHMYALYCIYNKDRVLDIIEYVLCIRAYTSKRVVQLRVSQYFCFTSHVLCVYLCTQYRPPCRLICLRTIESFVYIYFNKIYIAIYPGVLFLLNGEIIPSLKVSNAAVVTGYNVSVCTNGMIFGVICLPRYLTANTEGRGK